ncbi:hypothetical protein CABS01_11908 [Colletotrichum abscissum]|uniref:Uncharacterized protein n=1 Tax=Colletotrichum abscissum TaxID=1671311 RepID=A0A9P9XCP4_9PEZI|nr:uncharacterized protein CABS01_11908 [Colletotrichum abscissum]KAI3548883.1 hypothetical protein CABS02_08086 [Colletotrichum abscissum]KAK1492391.1 hypothetical protein CABS01_11908 [Colletotrichum abscissum]
MLDKLVFDMDAKQQRHLNSLGAEVPCTPETHYETSATETSSILTLALEYLDEREPEAPLMHPIDIYEARRLLLLQV